MNETIKIYEPLWIVKVFNSFPHLNMWFQQVNSTFNPLSFEHNEYLEAVLFWSVMPILFLILLLLILILYACALLCSKSCSKSSSNKIKHHHQNGGSSNKKLIKSKASLCRYKTLTIIPMILLAASLVFIVYGSQQFHHSYQDLKQGIINFSSHFDRMSNETLKIEKMILNDINTSIGRINAELNRQLNESQATTTVKTAIKEINSIKTTVNETLAELGKLNQVFGERAAYEGVLKQMDAVEQIRWSIMIGISVVNLVLIILLFTGILTNSKGSLCFFVIFAIVALISIWTLNALYLGLTVFISDFCVNPDDNTLEMANQNNIKPIVQFFTKCPINQQYTPFQQNFNTITRKLNTAQVIFKENLVPLSTKYIEWRNNNFSKVLESTHRVVQQTIQSIKCEQTSISFSKIVRVLCFNSVFGLSIVVLSGFIFGLLLPILICIVPRLWKRINNIYFEQPHEESHPFIPMAPTRTNISAARQYNESPNFQRLVPNGTSNSSSSSRNHHHNHHIHNDDPYLKSTTPAAASAVTCGVETTLNYNHYSNNTPTINSNNYGVGSIGNNNNMNKYSLNLNNSPAPPPNMPLYPTNRNNNYSGTNINGTLNRMNHQQQQQEQTLLMRRKY